MKTHSLILFLVLSLNSFLISQDQVDNILLEIEKNNTTLLSLRYYAEAQNIGNKTDIFLPNPEVGINYLVGIPGSVSNRTDFVVTQSFDYPTVYKFKNKIADLKNEKTELEYRKYRKELLLEAKLTCSEIIYLNALKLEFEKRHENAKKLADSYKFQLDAGETNILDLNKANLNLLNIKKDIESIEIELNSGLENLIRLNGGKTVELTVSSFESRELPVSYEIWFSQNVIKDPEIAMIAKESEIAKHNIELNKAQNLPKFNAGIMGELVKGEQYIGSTIGVSIPLWENRNKLEYARANAISVQGRLNDLRFQRDKNMRILYSKALALNKNLEGYKRSFSLMDNSSLLKKALDKGEISLIEYLMELALYYESYSKMFDLQKDFNNIIAELYSYL